MVQKRHFCIAPLGEKVFISTKVSPCTPLGGVAAWYNNMQQMDMAARLQQELLRYQHAGGQIPQQMMGSADILLAQQQGALEILIQTLLIFIVESLEIDKRNLKSFYGIVRFFLWCIDSADILLAQQQGGLSILILELLLIFIVESL